jgi:hypothetical protein
MAKAVNDDDISEDDLRVQAALAELREMILERYPTATFEVGRDPDHGASIFLYATVDLDDPDEVGDLVIDRLLELQIDEALPVHVIPLRTPARILAELRSRQEPSK